ncbi:helix-turn-helix domain-containing protein [Salmonella enterica]|nr:helix-turn-helix domain-containing protein [Salmonella enterica]EJJ0090917.1 helix-turn-helix domain-containing protein [Salmonella enterica]EJJ0101888.1 helix-turn-helix domain-containing protein [Salmonella enterica]EJJ3873832.1 helix-turn-helix domain-containing protein [Salmonella enterica]EJJ4298489.1 helix-turn-helix domain-containing protein [Salmonella enterica]
MFNVKRNGASVEITEIPPSIPFSVFKSIADETGADECLVAYVKDKDNYEVVIRHDSVNMAGAAAWLALESREPITGDADISTIGKRIGVMRVKQHMSAQELEDVIGAPEGSVFRWEVGKSVPSVSDLTALATVLKCEPEWLQGNARNAEEEKKAISPLDNIKLDFIVIGGFWREIARLSELNYLAAKALYENNESLCEWNTERINKLTSNLADAKTQNAVRITKNNWEFHL